MLRRSGEATLGYFLNLKVLLSRDSAGTDHHFWPMRRKKILTGS
jgi:hypothetical protein